jgi:hypothetical protein
VGYQPVDRLLTIARRGIVSVAGRSSRSAATLPESDGDTLRLRLIVDGSILEMEANGHTMATARLSQRASRSRTVALGSIGGPTSVHRFELWRLG